MPKVPSVWLFRFRANELRPRVFCILQAFGKFPDCCVRFRVAFRVNQYSIAQNSPTAVFVRHDVMNVAVRPINLKGAVAKLTHACIAPVYYPPLQVIEGPLGVFGDQIIPKQCQHVSGVKAVPPFDALSAIRVCPSPNAIFLPCFLPYSGQSLRSYSCKPHPRVAARIPPARLRKAPSQDLV